MQDAITKTIATEILGKTVQLVAIAGFVCASCFTGFTSRGDDSVTKPQDRAASLGDVLGNIVAEGSAALLSSLHVGEGVEMSLWETILSPDSLTHEELRQFDGSIELKGVLLVQLIVPNESAVREKRRSAPFAEGALVQVSCDVLKRDLDRPIASMYYVDARQGGPRLQVAAFFVFDIERKKWSRVPSSPSK